MDPTQGSTTGDELEMTPEQLAADAAEDALFEAGFTTANGETPGTEASTSTATTAASAAAATSTEGDGTLEHDPATGTPLVQPGAAPNDDDAPVTITKRQLAELSGTRDLVLTLQGELRKTVDSTNGRLGSIQQTLKEVKEQASQGIRPSFEQMEALEEEFPELAATLKRDLTRIFGRGNETQPEGQDGDASGAAAPGAAQTTNPLDAPEVQAELRKAQLAIVDATHAGWRQLPATPEWAAWQNQLPPQAQELLRTAKDAATLNDAIADFKDYQQRQAAAASASNQRGKRLEHAVPATTGSSTGHAHVPNEDEAFEAGFKRQSRR
jgi:hypothetical protein